MLFYFDITNNNKQINTVHLCDYDGGFTQSVTYFREKYSAKAKSDKHYYISSNDKNSSEKSFNSKYKNVTKLNIKSNKHPKYKNCGNMLSMAGINEVLKKLNKVNADLVTGDGEFKWDYINVQEQNMYLLLLAQIYVTFNIQSKNGSAVFKIYETFTPITLKIIALLDNAYNSVYIIKPLTSKPHSSEKYVVCVGFKDPKIKLKELEKLINTLSKSDKYVSDIFTNYKIPKSMNDTFVKLNNELSNDQFKYLNQMMTYIEKNNYRGEVYNERRNMQIDATKYWINSFYPKPSDFNKNKKDLAK
jgi:hypothetical protein